MVKLSDRHKAIYAGELCPVCGGGVKRVSETDIYRREYTGKEMVACEYYPSCDTYVGTHKDSGLPLGRLAGWVDRMKKKKAHKFFDPLWKEGHMTRPEAYAELAEYLGVPPEYCHMGMMNSSNLDKTAVWAVRRMLEFKNAATT